MKNIINDRPIRVGVAGAGRGLSFGETTRHTGMEFVAVCDIWEKRLTEVSEKYGIAGYSDYGEFLKHDMDAVVIATPFPMHTGFAIKALDAGKHVLSETSCNATLAEGVSLCRKVEETGLCYMLAENYCYTKFNLEMKYLYENGEIGDVTYAEGEYNHPMSPDSRLAISPGVNHWRSQIPPTYYNTHALAPLMYITDTIPVSVNALSIKCDEVNKDVLHTGDVGCAMLCRMDNGAVFRLFGLLLPGHSCYYRLHGSEGAMETERGPGYFGTQRVRVWHEEWTVKEGVQPDVTYEPKWRANADIADKAGHGGGDFWVEHYFAEAIKTGVQPFLDVYRGVAMSNAGILAWRSALENGKPVEIPDFRDENVRKKYENDIACPFTCVDNADLIPAHTGKKRDITPEAFERACRVWKEAGYSDAEIERLLIDYL